MRITFSELDADARSALPDSAFGWIDSGGKRHLPIHDANHVRAALARMNQVKDSKTGARPGGLTLKRIQGKIKSAGKKFGVAMKSNDMDWDDKEEPDENEGDDPTRADDGSAPTPGLTISDVHVPAPFGNKKARKAAKKAAKKARKQADDVTPQCCDNACGRCQGVGCGCCPACFVPGMDDDDDDDDDDWDGNVQSYTEGSPHIKAKDGTGFRMFLPFAAGEWIQYMPAPGKWQSPRYGEIELTPERNDRMVKNFNAGAYQNHIPVDAEHESKLSGAMGWIEQMRLNSDGSVGAYVDWTPRGETMLAEKRFKYFSPEWYDDWTDPATERSLTDVAIGGALTTRPFFKPSSLKPLVATDGGWDGLKRVKAKETGKMAKDEPNRMTELEAEVAKISGELKSATEKLTQAKEESRVASEAKTAAEQTAIKLTERIEAIESAARVAKLTETAKQFAGDTTTHVRIMSALDDEAREAYVGLQTGIAHSAAEAMKALGRPIGVSTAQANVGGSAVADAIKASEAAVAASAGKTSYAKAMTEYWTSHPEAYEQYLAETGN